MALFFKSKKKAPKEVIRGIKRKINRDVRDLERQIAGVQREEKKVQAEIKKLAKKQQMVSVKVLAKSLVRSRKAKDRLWEARASLNSVRMQIQQQYSITKVAQGMKASTKVMELMPVRIACVIFHCRVLGNLLAAFRFRGKLCSVPEIAEQMRNLAQEMNKAGVIEEMINDGLDAAFDTEDMDDAIATEVDAVVGELCGDFLSSVQAAPTTLLEAAAPVAVEQDVAEEANDGALLQARLDAL